MAMLPSVSVIVGDSKKPPECPHGPALLFKRVADGEETLFYACSACRDRKGCHFYLNADQEFDDSKKKLWEMEAARMLPKIDHRKLYVRLMKLVQSSIGRVYCHDCNELLSTNDAKKHREHDITTDLSDYEITHPSEVLKPIENPKKEAQYLFNKKTTQTLVAALKNLGCKHILCIGAPRVHEYILSECSDDMDSLLLDIDHRYHHFFGPLQFCWYNAFNNYYFNKSTGAQVVNDFLQQDSGTGIAIIIDPPFGGRVEPLAHTIKQINKQHQALNPSANSDLKVLWTYPYFLEQHILTSLPEYKMLDYKVDYDNHALFTKGTGGRKYGSPVRIFTNISPKEFPLPEDEGYRFCKPCKRWVSQENKHCKKCSNCTSKDGRTYVHCDICEKCVKPNRSHCDVCKQCLLADHKCDEVMKASACFKCGKMGHKMADCKKRVRKRKSGQNVANGAIKKQKFEHTEEPRKEMGKKKGKRQHFKSVDITARKKMKNGKPIAEMPVKPGKMNLNVQKNSADNEQMKKMKKKSKGKQIKQNMESGNLLDTDLSPKKGKLPKSPKKTGVRVRNKMKKKLDIEK